jgi:hypothetical protein
VVLIKGSKQACIVLSSLVDFPRSKLHDISGCDTTVAIPGYNTILRFLVGGGFFNWSPLFYFK